MGITYFDTSQIASPVMSLGCRPVGCFDFTFWVSIPKAPSM